MEDGFTARATVSDIAIQWREMSHELASGEEGLRDRRFCMFLML
jgi:hypothetical protein